MINVVTVWVKNIIRKDRFKVLRNTNVGIIVFINNLKIDIEDTIGILNEVEINSKLKDYHVDLYYLVKVDFVL